jgi:hypothetical protein
MHCYTTTSFAKETEDGYVESLLFLTLFVPPAIFFCFCYVLDVTLRLLVEV